MYLAIKKSLTPEYQMSEEQFEERYNNYLTQFKEAKELEEGQKARVCRLIQIKKMLPKNGFMQEKKKTNLQ